MSTHAYLPDRDGELEFWAVNFSACINGEPARYGLTPDAAATLAALVTDYAARRAVATDITTRTRVTITRKDTARAALKRTLRQLARIVNAHPGIADSDRERLGLRPRDPGPTPVPVPENAPCVVINTLGALRSDVRLSDESAPTRRGRPAGTLGAFLWASIGDPAPQGTEQCRFLGLATRTRHTVQHAPAALNKTVWILAQWVNPRGEPGPLSRPVSASIAA